MDIIKFNPEKKSGSFKLLNGINGGPVHKRHANDQKRSNFKQYKAARIPYCRNHDTEFNNPCHGPFNYNISIIFPNFDADVNDPASYDFPCTDEQIFIAMDADAQPFFRLGQSIEDHIKKHHTLPPKDYQKWAEICEHIIRHYNEGWADGYELNVKYWEIWNEPDYKYDQEDKPAWGGSQEDFIDFYEVVAKHLKKCFPDVKIGGPALFGHMPWADTFLKEMQNRQVPMDFFSWHCYAKDPMFIAQRANEVKEMLAKYGYGDIESILDAWNYVKDWDEDFQYTIDAIRGLKGASYILSSICEGQKAPIDLMMYYDVRNSVFNGIFNVYSLQPLKGYYSLYWYGMFYDMDCEIRAENKIDDLYTLCGVDKSGKTQTVVTYFSENDNAPAKEFSIDFGRPGKYEIYKLDNNNDGALIDTTENLTFTLGVHESLLIKEI